MKKNLLYVFLLISFLGFSQESVQKIQAYINENKAKLHLNASELNQWQIESETSSETTGITNYLVTQTYNGIKIDNSYIYFWIKNGKIVNEPEGFITDLASKITTTTPGLNVVAAFSTALTKMNEQQITTSIIETNKNKYKLTNGLLTEDPVSAELVYFPSQNGSLILTWSFEFYSQNAQHLWKIKVNATNGDVLEKFDLTHNCSFGPRHNHATCMSGVKTKNISFSLFKNNQSAMLLTPGTTNYRVIPWNYESPFHTSRQLITNPEATTALAPLTNAASPNGWHNASTTIGGTTTTYNYTRGNNVFAYSDYTNANPASPTTYAPASAGTYPSLTFDYTYGGNAVAATTYINAAITNLFYMNNMMHDLWYQYGFNEANRNFQAQNLGRGGSGNDAVNAEAQDGSQAATPTLNNANFSTPSDGSKPRMQMYVWNSKKPSTLLVNTGTLANTSFNVIDNSFNPGHVNLPVAPATLTNTIVLVDDGTPDTSDACETIINAAAVNGKIAVIRRGTCTFVSKALMAQNAGAIAVIIVNNTAGYVGMSGADANITIPVVSMSQADGEALIAALASSSISVSISTPEIYVNGDGDFDNGVIAHEYTHGISTRLVGGGAGLNSAEQPGEGWSDWAWLMMQIKPGDTRNDARGIGTFVSNQAITGPGIREFRYSTDMTVNPHTFGDTNDQWFTDSSGIDQIDVHGLGSIWCVMLWDLAWDYIDKYGYNSNLFNGTGGNNKVMRLVIDAMKLTPANPTLIQCRNALIQADLATTNGQDYCLIWHAFARRGMGVNATSGANSGVAGVQDQVEDFTEPIPGSTAATGSNCTMLAANYYQNNDLFNIYPNPTNGNVNIQIHNYSGALQVKVYDLNGRQVFTQNISNFELSHSLNLGNLTTGVYVLKLEGEQLNHTQKIIIK
ncbi:T9SS-dependent M36 family metallopeptidase [Flavobacterium sp. 20NA77.7]|uniref:T9SS-dependent M36 family metallopeptidase n=1 Tax=Flavobacterium nakdongensis TaxID=3073563 RepID=A0ABY9RDA8_9FLAO|nr:T9SS-dependent M36 family metallopeptidase [Flavobacterium sp. 20NA77.7]WMW78162.1 T9SS-dependent M36 family metallopeptidase [Flavobacterium sp. 20NA77.7]